MQADVRNPSERKKLILAVSLGVVAIVFLWWTFFGFGGSSPRKNAAKMVAPPNGSPTPRVLAARGQPATALQVKDELLNQLRPIIYQPATVSLIEPKRNIFVYYQPPPPLKQSLTPSPTPTPTPPVLVASVSPASVYAQTNDFTLDVTGDKFAPAMRVAVDGRELPTRFVSPQQVSTVVPASVIATAGSRQITLRSPDGKLYSNPATLNVTAPPTPNYGYVAIIGTHRHLDTAILQDKSSKEILNVQRGDVLGGRFRVTSISDKELVVVDTNLKIKHTLPFSSEVEKSFSPVQRPTPKVDSEDDEP